jgi:predicted  nucleic acid-binding Zn-ribbon protein
MKKSIVFLLAVLFVSCHNYKKDVENLQGKVDSLQNVAVQKDTTIENFLDDFTEIQANLDSIKKLEEMIDMPEEPEQRISDNRKQRILADISAINNLLKKNRDLISNLRRRLNNASMQSGKLESMVNDLEKVTQNLEENIKEKDAEIAGLNQRVQEQSEDITELTEQIETMEQATARQLDSLALKEAELNKAFYIRGTISNLKDMNVVEREGGILGIGSTPVVKEDFAKEMFTQVDIREFDYLPLDSRKADVISVHPKGSYHISGENSADTLFVDDAEEFWSASKYLVVVTK